ncbi:MULTISPECIES: hypothetical protein [unclassified Neisseria]|nr:MULTISPECIES: hypothetical protein [unclassified Neisseria]
MKYLSFAIRFAGGFLPLTLRAGLPAPIHTGQAGVVMVVKRAAA